MEQEHELFPANCSKGVSACKLVYMLNIMDEMKQHDTVCIFTSACDRALE